MEKWGAVSRPAVILVIGGRLSPHWPSCTRRDRPNRLFGNSRIVLCAQILIKVETDSLGDVLLLLLG